MERGERATITRRRLPTASGLAGTVAAQRRAFDRLAAAYRNDAAPNHAARSEAGPTDPVHLVRRYADPLDREVAGLICAVFAYGQVETLCRAAESILAALGPSPRAALLEGRHRMRSFCPRFRYRFNRRRDLIGLLHAVAGMLGDEGSLGRALAARRRAAADMTEALGDWVADLRARAEERTGRSRGLDHLLADPRRGSACKRWWLYLRWMVRRDDGTDLGVWSGLIPASDLLVPLDTHWIRLAPRLGLTRRRTPGGAMAREITAALRRIDPRDPVRYDYPVCHLGIDGKCPPRLRPEHCGVCPLRRVCATGSA